MKNNKGITMVALIITIIIIIIIAGISIGAGSKVIDKTQLENLATNMLLIKGKAKEYVENANFNLGTSVNSLSESEKEQRISKAKESLKGTEVEDASEFFGNIGITEQELQEEKINLNFYYKLSTEDLKDIGLTNVKSDEKNGWYIIRYSISDSTVEIYNEKGFTKEDITYYALSDIENLEL